MENELEQFDSHLSQYRGSVDNLFSSALQTPAHWQAAISQVLLCVTQLFLDYLIVSKLLNTMTPTRSSKTRSYQSFAHVEAEGNLRQRLKTHFDTSSTFLLFDPAESMFELIGLKRRQDYLHSLCLHLPEMYGESINLQHHLKSFQSDHNDRAHAKILVGLQHLSRNHGLFVQPALDEAAGEASWREA